MADERTYRELTGFLADRGVSPRDGEALLDLVAVGLARLVWHDGPPAAWLAGDDTATAGDVLRLDVAATKLVRFTLATSGYDLEAVFHALTDDWPLPTGQGLHGLAGERWPAFADHAVLVLGALMEDVDEGGLERSVLRVAADAAITSPHHWGTPWWPEVALLLAGTSASAGDGARRRRTTADATPARPRRLTDVRLAEGLRTGPDRFDRGEADWVAARLAEPGCHVDGYARWRAGRRADPTAPFVQWRVEPEVRHRGRCPCGSGLAFATCHGQGPQTNGAKQSA